jgi:hypothetical protein
MQKAMEKLDALKAAGQPYPDMLDDLAGGPYVDAWGNPFVYRMPGLGADYDLISLGADNEEGGEASPPISLQRRERLLSRRGSTTLPPARSISKWTPRPRISPRRPMGYTYERTLAPSEEVSNYASRKLGLSAESVIFADYLHFTGAPIKPPGESLSDFSDTGVADDYVKLLVARHAPTINEKQLRADRRVKDALPVPDISTYAGRFVPPRILARDPAGKSIEDTSRNEYYEIKPNSDDGERDGRAKLAKIRKSYDRYGLHLLYQPGTTYPRDSPTYIKLKWSEAFEYLRLVFMWENNLRTCDVDLQVVRHPEEPGLLLYAFRIRLELDVQLAQDKLRAFAAGIAFAIGLCEVAGILELGAALQGAEIAKSLLEAAKALQEHGPEELPKFRIAPDPPIGPRVNVPPETLQEPPEVRVEPEDNYDTGEEELPKLKRAIAEAVIGRGYALPGKKMDVFCDEDYFQNIIFDDSIVRRFVGMTRLAVPLSPTLTVSSAYLRMAIPGYIVAKRLLEQIEKRFPNQMKLSAGQRIPEALRDIARQSGNSQVTVVSQVLIQTSAMAAFIDPTLAANVKRRVDRAGGGLGRGKIALPQSILSRMKGRDGSAGVPSSPPTLDTLAAALLGPNPDERNRKFLKDALSAAGLKQALNTNPGFTLAIGVHALYLLPSGPVTEQNHYGELKAVNMSRLFAVNIKDGATPPAKTYQPANSGSVADTPQQGSGSYRYIGRLKVRI